MSALLGAFIAAIVGAVIAGAASFGLVTSQTAVPAPVDKEYVVYGTS